MIPLLIVTSVALMISAYRDWEKTKGALLQAVKRMIQITPPLMGMIILVSISLYFLTPERMEQFLLNSDKSLQVPIAGLLGSVSMMPGFIAFPLGGFFKDQGLSYMAVSAFTTTLMMVGIVTIPLEKKFFGLRVTLIRNTISLVIALLVALATGIFFGEVGI